MTRTVRRVPPDWVHPEDSHGQFIALYDSPQYVKDIARWDEEAVQWQRGFQRRMGTDDWEPLDAELRTIDYTDYEGPRSDPKDYMPQWPADACTH